jgi:hypothetical protein
LMHNVSPEQVFASLSLLRDFQRTLIETSVPVYWFNDVLPEHTAFAAAQYLAVTGIMPGCNEHLHFYPDKPIMRAEAAYALAKLFSLAKYDKEKIDNKTRITITDASNMDNLQNATVNNLANNDLYAKAAIEACLACGLLNSEEEKFDSEKPLSANDLKTMARNKLFRHIDAANTLPNLETASDGSLTRAQFAIWLYTIAQSKSLFGKK